MHFISQPLKGKIYVAEKVARSVLWSVMPEIVDRTMPLHTQVDTRVSDLRRIPLSIRRQFSKC
jgi:hypothetical protein